MLSSFLMRLLNRYTFLLVVFNVLFMVRVENAFVLNVLLSAKSGHVPRTLNLPMITSLQGILRDFKILVMFIIKCECPTVLQ